MTKLEEILTKIAHRNLGIETLETSRSFQDFHDGVAVWQLKKALEEAYLAGQSSITSQRYLKKETQNP